MEYRAVGSRIAVILESLHLPLSYKEVLSALYRESFRIVDVPMVSLARQCIGVSMYKRGIGLREAPAVVDCSGFTKWLYGQKGIWLPRRSIQQREFGEAVDVNDITTHDLVFTSGRIGYYNNDPEDGVGHVGIVTDHKTVIHAANSEVNVVESSIDDFVNTDCFRGVRRYMPKDTEVITLEIPAGREVEIADDIRWIILQSLPR